MKLSKLIAAGVIVSLFSFGVCQIQDGVAHSTNNQSLLSTRKKEIKHRIQERFRKDNHPTPNVVQAFSCGSSTVDFSTHDDTPCGGNEVPANTNIILSYGSNPVAGTMAGAHFPVNPPQLLDLTDANTGRFLYRLRSPNLQLGFPSDLVVRINGTANGNPIALVKCGYDFGGSANTDLCGFTVSDYSGWNSPNETFNGQMLVSSIDLILYGTEPNGHQVTLLNGFQLWPNNSPTVLPVSTQVTGCPSLPAYPCF